MERFNLAPLFDLILIEGEFGTGKPDPHVFQYALEKLGASPSDTWMVGDDLEYDIRPAGELGIGTVWVYHALTGLPPQSGNRLQMSVHSIVELVENRHPIEE